MAVVCVLILLGYRAVFAGDMDENCIADMDSYFQKIADSGNYKQSGYFYANSAAPRFGLCDLTGNFPDLVAGVIQKCENEAFRDKAVLYSNKNHRPELCHWAEQLAQLNKK